MIKLSHILTGALVASAVMFADWATAAPLSATRTLSRADQMAPLEEQTEQGYEAPAQFKRQIVAYNGNEAPGTIIIDTGNTFLYLVPARRQGDPLRHRRRSVMASAGRACSRSPRRPSGRIGRRPAEMIARQPYLPRFMAGGPTNPLGARAMYLGSTVYRIHGTTRPRPSASASPRAASALTNEDVIDLASRVMSAPRWSCSTPPTIAPRPRCFPRRSACACAETMARD